jgi:hypothetical protein
MKYTQTTIISEENIVIKPKRGRKPKKNVEFEKISEVIETDNDNNPSILIKETDINKSNLKISINEMTDTNELNNIVINMNIQNDDNDVNIENIVLKEDDTNEGIKNILKKRGRKPKGGKIIQHLTPLNNEKKNKTNIILHLKCYLKDLTPNNLQNNNIESYNFSNNNDLTYELINNKVDVAPIDPIDYEIDNDPKDKYKEIWKKIKQLENNLHINNISDKKSACFWCTYDFDNPPIYIPKYFIKNTYHVYGCFCSPECGTAFLMEENIDSSTKFERYHFINHLYAKIYNYEKNIKPAPNPYYMLDKFYGNLSIQEYRSLFKNERLFLIVDKPLTRVLPELHEDNDDFILNNKIIPTNNYNIKRKLQQKTQNKTNILNETFGLSTI